LSPDPLKVTVLTSRYVTLKLNSGKAVHYINTFYTKKALDSTARRVGNSSHLGNGILLVEDYDKTQVENSKLLFWDTIQ
jgi:hypothetical protein